ncbi:hypothetical protein DFJ77DRAFT_201060 [Powellomyces hirtus]|nr:hypothetical protein DFJ77DRAFT_201060 [Powellomyces hirtus]
MPTRPSHSATLHHGVRLPSWYPTAVRGCVCRYQCVGGDGGAFASGKILGLLLLRARVPLGVCLHLPHPPLPTRRFPAQRKMSSAGWEEMQMKRCMYCMCMNLTRARFFVSVRFPSIARIPADWVPVSSCRDLLCKHKHNTQRLWVRRQRQREKTWVSIVSVNRKARMNANFVFGGCVLEMSSEWGSGARWSARGGGGRGCCCFAGTRTFFFLLTVGFGF